ncbi:protein phosphatase 2C [Dictyocaulus viviparus]|uniref:protein-serine/threonine phosphatase n=1 Tax=Dictyocaulus viviparus TaxID=29172 RepID=A0A0D8Y4S8_DICVI|nr:protein phosphatase 2C [Dictyocaulus viviparus]
MKHENGKGKCHPEKQQKSSNQTELRALQNSSTNSVLDSGNLSLEYPAFKRMKYYAKKDALCSNRRSFECIGHGIYVIRLLVHLLETENFTVTYIMGAYLDKPVTEKESESGHGNGLTYGATCMQGWRVKQEDAHNCIIDLNGDWSMFAVYDGHGGDEVSKYTAMKLPNFLKERQFWANDDFVASLQQIFVEFDDVLRSEEVMKQLKRMAHDRDGYPERDEDGDNSSDEYDRIQTIDESSIPLEEILSRQGYIVGRNPPRSKTSIKCCNNERGCGEDRSTKGKRQSQQSPTEEPAKRAKTEGNGNLLNKLITQSDENNHDNHADFTENIDPTTAEEAIGEASIANIVKNSPIYEGLVDGRKPNETEMTTAVIKTKQKKVPTNLEKKELSDDGISDEEDSEDDSDFTEADVEAEDEDCDDEDDAESDDDCEEVDIPGGLETPGEDSGTTACVCLMNKQRIVVANAGDSRAVLCRGGTAVDLSIDHKPEDDIEKTRIVNAGGFVNEDGRVNGGLNLSRAFGDHSYKKNLGLPLRDQMITALPDVKVEPLQPDDEFLVVACDGIWWKHGVSDKNSLNSQQVIDFVRERLKLGKSCVDISSELCDHCLAPTTAGDGTGCDNMTVIITTITH